MEVKVFAYIRVSTQEQNTDRQVSAIKNYCRDNNINLDERDVFIDKASGRDFNREAYQALKLALRKGDTLIIKELDRLGRDMQMIKDEWQWLLKRGINIILIDTPILNTKDKSDLEKSLISNIIFELLTYMAQKERLKIKQRRTEGIAIAKSQGKHLGRPKAQYPEQFEKVYDDWKNGNITAVKAMDQLKLKKNTFYKLVKEFEGK
jgi:DNA invertase Pin-like site-specific DNA recombinase